MNFNFQNETYCDILFHTVMVTSFKDLKKHKQMFSTIPEILHKVILLSSFFACCEFSICSFTFTIYMYYSGLLEYMEFYQGISNTVQ